MPAPDFQWRFNGTNMPGATNTTWMLTNAQPADAGNYSVIARNFVGAIASQQATLVVVSPVRLTALGHSAEGFRFRLDGPPGTYGIEASENMASWSQLFSADAPTGTVEAVDPEAAFLQQRFYRAVRSTP
jgi:hypothetical protein